MAILNDKTKDELYDSLEGLRLGIPLLAHDDRDFTASVLYKMAEIVREHGPSHGVSLTSPEYLRLGNYQIIHHHDGSLGLITDPVGVEGGRRGGGKLYETSRWAYFTERCRQNASESQIRESDIEKVIYDPPATVIYWKDGTKTVVKCSDQDLAEGRMSPETGVVYAIAKKVLGNKGNYNDVLRRLVNRAKKS